MSNLMLFPIHDEPDQQEQSVALDGAVDNRLIRASAGTGKTYQLTTRYLRLLLDGAAPDSILATTFTRKAAGEILQRVVRRLAIAAVEPDELEALRQAVDLPSLTREHCQDKLRLLVGSLHRLKICTLDAFFMQLAMLFSLELGLTPGWQVLEAGGAEGSQLKQHAIAGVLTDEAVEDLLTLVHQLAPKGEAKRSLAALLSGRVNDAYRLFLESTAEAWDGIEVPAPLPNDECQELARAIRQVEVKAKSIREARDNDVSRILAEDWKGFFESGRSLIRSLMAGKEKYGNARIPSDLLTLYQRFLRHLRALILRSASAQTRGTHAFLTKYHAWFERLKHERRLQEFDDVTRLLARHARAQEARALAFRMDASIDHLLLDEFQDTSIPQWQALTGLVRRCTNGEPGRSFFCVGDVKQAIYGWRGGSSEIFDLLDQRLPDLNNFQLQESRRSAPVIIDTVNRVFAYLPEWEKLQRARRAARDWQFAPHTTVHDGMPGHVTLETAEPPEEPFTKSAQEEQVLRRAARRVAAIASQADDRAIGVLCRKNVMVARMMHELHRAGVPASEEGGNLLTDSAAVQLVLSHLHLADHPADTVAAFHLASSPWADALGLRFDDGKPARDDGKPFSHLASQVRRQLADQGFGETIRGWAAELAPFCNRREARRLQQLVEKAYQYQANLEAPRQLGYERQRRVSSRPTEFIRFIRETRVADPSMDQVRVMTVHQAKGLQFDVVVLPDLLGPLVEGAETFLYRRESIDREIDLICRYMGKDSGRPFLPAKFQPLFDQFEDRKATESLCVLYVAMTRAKHAMHLIIPADLRGIQNESAARLIKDALAEDCELVPATTVYEAGDPDWRRAASGQADSRRAAPTAPRPRLARRTAARRHLEVLAPSELSTTGRRRLQPRAVSGDESRPREWGRLVHDWLAQIPWLDRPASKALPSPLSERLRQIAVVHADRLDVDDLLTQFQTMLSTSPLSEILCRDAYLRDLRSRLPNLPSNLELEVRTEQHVAGRDGAAILSGSIDRLVLVRAGGSLFAADVIDFKTASSNDEASTRETKRDRYLSQVAAYQRMVSTSLRLDVERVATKLAFLPFP